MSGEQSSTGISRGSGQFSLGDRGAPPARAGEPSKRESNFTHDSHAAVQFTQDRYDGGGYGPQHWQLEKQQHRQHLKLIPHRPSYQSVSRLPVSHLPVYSATSF